MEWFVLGIAGLILWAASVVLAAWLVPTEVRVVAKGLGEFGRSGAVTAGLQFGSITVSSAMAYDGDSVLQAHFGGLAHLHISPLVRSPGRPRKTEVQLLGGTLRLCQCRRRLEVQVAGIHTWRRVLRKKTKPPPEPPVGVWERLKASRAKVERWFEPRALMSFLLDQRRNMRINHLRGKLAFSTPDLAWTGVISGALYTFAGLLAPFGAFRVEPRWEAVASAEGNIDFAFSTWPFRFMANAIVFSWKNLRMRERTVSQVAPAQL